jgi:hypothetical protein
MAGSDRTPSSGGRAAPKSGGFLSGLAKGIKAAAESAKVSIGGSGGGGGSSSGGSAGAGAAAGAPATDAACEVFFGLAQGFHTPCCLPPRDGEAAAYEDEALDLLARLWHCAVAEELAARGEEAEFAPVHPAWALLGFAGSDPLSEVRSGGLLALRALVYMAECHTALFMAAALDPPAPQLYKLALCVLMLAARVGTLFELHAAAGPDAARALVARPHAAWALLDLAEGEVAFYELVVLSFRAFDQLWHNGTQEGGAGSGSASGRLVPVMEATVARTRAWIAAGPRSLQELNAIARR